MKARFALWVDHHLSWLLVLPVAAVTFGLLGVPAAMMLGDSINCLWEPERRAFLFQDPELVSSIRRSFVYALTTGLAQLGIGLFAATTIHRLSNSRLAELSAFVGFLPYTIPSAVTALIWQLLCRANGILARATAWCGLAPDQHWLYSGPGLLLTVILASVWQFSPFVLVTLLARMRRIDPALYRVSELDGASAFQQFLHVTWPEIRSTLWIVFLLRFAFMFTKFDLPWLLGGKTSNNAADTLPVYVWRMVSSSKDASGYRTGALAATVLAVLLIATIALAVGLFALVRALALRLRSMKFTSQPRRLLPNTPESTLLRLVALLGLGAILVGAAGPCLALLHASLLSSRTIGDGLPVDGPTLRRVSIENYRLLFSRPTPVSANSPQIELPSLKYLGHAVITVLTSGVTAFTVLILAIPAGYCLTRFRYRWHTVWCQAPLVGYLFPPIVLLIPYHKLLGLTGWDNTLPGLVLAHIAFCLPFGLWLMIPYFAAIPRQFDIVAELDGATKLRALRRVLIRRALPGIVAVANFSFVLSWNDVALASDLIRASRNWPLVPFIDQEILKNADAVSQYGEFAAASILIVLVAIAVLGTLNSWVDRKLRKEGGG